MPHPITLPEPLALGPFVIHARLGQGGMGSVWRGHHARRPEVEVAVKVISADRARDPRYQRLFRREVRAVANLTHPSVVRVLDHGQIAAEVAARSGGHLAAESPFLVMALSPLPPLTARQVTRWGELRGLLLALLDALAATHARGVLHLDLKPSNVLARLAPGPPQAVLIDFGLATLDADGDREVPGGTPAYMAPERLEPRWRHLQGPSTDLYALGCLAWQLVTGRPPFQGSPAELREAHLTRAPPPLDPRFPVPDGLEGWLLGLLRKDPYPRLGVRAADVAWALSQLPDPPEGAAAEPAPRPSDAPTRTTLYAQGTTRSFSDLSWWTEAPPEPGASPTVTEATEAPSARFEPPPPPATWRQAPRQPHRPLEGTGLRLYGLRAVPVVGRPEEQAELWGALLQAAGSGRPRWLTISGPAGTGKSCLAGWLGERAEERGAALTLRLHHDPSDVPGAALARLVARATRCADLPSGDAAAHLDALTAQLGEIAPDARRVLLEMATGVAQGARAASLQERHRAAAALLALLASRRPVLLWLDDVQWGADSLRLAQQLMAREAPLLMVATAREEALPAEPEATALLDALHQHPRARRLPLAPLPDAAHRTLVRLLLGLDSDLVDASEHSSSAAARQATRAGL